MKQTKFVKIDSFAQDDINGMFNFICETLLKISTLKGKRNILGLSGKDSQLEKHNVTIGQLLEVIKRYELAVELKISYMEEIDVENEVSIPKDDKLPVDATQYNMEKQRQAITNPELIEPTVSEIKIDNKDIPPIPDFL